MVPIWNVMLHAIAFEGGAFDRQVKHRSVPLCLG